MAFVTDLLHYSLNAFLMLLTQPFYYLGILFIMLQYRRQVYLERKLFHTKLHSMLDETLRTVAVGWIAGISASIIMAFVGATIQTDVLPVLWVVSLLLIFVRTRFLCFAYAIGIVGVAHSLLTAVPSWKSFGESSWMLKPIVHLNISSLLAIVAVFHLVEALLIRWQGARAASPVFMEGKRGRIVGGYQLQGFWPVPLFLIVPVQSVTHAALPWHPLLGGDLWAGGWTMLAFPIVIGFTEMTTSRIPKAKVAWSSSMLILYSVFVFIMAMGTAYWPILGIGASILCIALHELLVWYSRWEEAQRTPIYIHDARGLMILGVVPSSPAAELGIVTGEIIHKVNGLKIETKEDLHQAVQLNSAFCKLEIINRDGHSKFVQRAMFSGEPHQLGIILSPDQAAMYYISFNKLHIFGFIRTKLFGIFPAKTNNR